jgi:hypothetical protein
MYANLAGTPEQVDTTMDSVVIRKVDHDIPGGKTLDVTGITDTVLKAGHVIIENTSTGAHKPLGIKSGAYDSLPSGHAFKGLLTASILTATKQASVGIAGDVNGTAAVNSGLPPYTSTIKNALTRWIFSKD